MRRVLSGVSRSVAVLAVLVGGAGRAGAGPLNPGDFTPVGPFPTAGRDIHVQHTGPNPTLSGTGRTTLTGVVSNGIAVFDFNSITVGSGQTFVGEGALPLALLSRSDITINGTIDVSAPGGFDFHGGPGGFDGASSGPGAGGFGPGGGGAGGFTFISVPQPPYGPTINYNDRRRG
jgi:hypothetical protein